MKEIYNAKKIEYKVQKYWKKNKTFEVKEDTNKQKYYCLSMIPYPSGKLHIGHVRNYVIGDIISRFQRMLGKNVLNPIGWDAFGLPAEIAAIKNNCFPNVWTYRNIKNMKKQMQSIGLSFDWSREIITCDPNYYKWEQWFFIKLYKKKIIYKKLSTVNWCNKDKTVLANEQVINGCCWRCETPIKNKKIKQWFIKITKYADQLLDDLKLLNNWPIQIKNMQKNWIGKSTVMEIELKIENSYKKIKVFMKRLDIFMEVFYISISINHSLVKRQAKKHDSINKFVINNYDNFINNLNKLSNTSEPKGYFLKINAIHPINKNILPIWINNFVDTDYKNNATASTPNHNVYDYKFAKKYKIFFSNNLQKNIHNINNNIAHNLIKTKLLKLNIYKDKIRYKLRDWCISRQRCWGTPIPIIYLKKNKILPESYHKLPVILPIIYSKNKLHKSISFNENFINIKYKKEFATRDKDTFDTFIESSWYYLRYTSPNYNKGIFNINSANYWLPIDQYIGGIEHAIMHLMYFRFFHKLFYEFGLVKTKEPAIKLLCQGMVLSDTFYFIDNQGNRNWVSPKNVKIKINKLGKKIFLDKYNNKLIYAGKYKMSKSKANGVNPQNIIVKYGADTLRLFIISSAPPEMNLDWNENGIKGSNNFLKRIWKMVFIYINKYNIYNKKIEFKKLNNKQKKILFEINKTILHITTEMNIRQKFNTVISKIIKLINIINKFSIINDQDRIIYYEGLIVIIKMLYPFTPHIAFKLWKFLGNMENIDFIEWPVVNKKFLKEKNKLIIIQINGILRKKILFPINYNKNLILKNIYKNKYLIKYLINKKIKKIIYIKNKLINLVLE